MIYRPKVVPVFRKLPTGKKSEHIAEQLLGAIRQGAFSIGDKLPPVEFIARETGVSPPTVREALGALRLLGIIESKTGSGTYVSRTELDRDDLHALLAGTGNPFAALEARRYVEPLAAELAIGSDDHSGIEAVHSDLEAMRVASKAGDLESLYKADRAFHLDIAEASGNGFISAFIQELLDIFLDSRLGSQIRRAYLFEQEFRLYSLQLHEQIYEQIEEESIEGTRLLFAEHFRAVEEQILSSPTE